MRRARPTLARSAHAGGLALALLALSLSLLDSGLFLPLALAAAGVLATPFLEWTSVPPRLRSVLPRAHALALLVAAVTAWFSRSMGVLLLPPDAIAVVAAPALVPVWVAFALAPRAFRPGRTLVPGIVGAIALAGLDPAPAGYDGSRLPFLQGGDRNAFGEVYLVLAILVVAALWLAALATAGPRWSRRTVVGAVLVCVVAAALAATGVVGLPAAQPRVERAFAAAFDQGTTGLSDESRLGDIGALAPSRRRVLDLQTSLPSGGHWRLPSQVFTAFDGRRWTNAVPRGRPTPARPRVLLPAPAPDGVGSVVAGLGAWFSGPGTRDGASATAGGPTGVEMRVTQAEVTDWPLLLPRNPTAVTAHASHLEIDRFGLVRRPRGLPLRQYGAVLGAAASPSSGAADELAPEERSAELTLPERVDPRTVSLARSLAAPAADPRLKVAATVHHLQTAYRYTLSPGPFRPGGDPIAEFLFEKRAAYCEYFATAAVVLLRLQGVPSRFVKGLSVGAQTDVGGGLHVVRERDAHAWIEAWIPGQGWVEADPTPPGQFESARGTPGRWMRWLEHARAALNGAWRRLTEGGLLAFLRWAGGLVLSLAGRLAREPLVWTAVLALALGPRLLRRLRRRRSRVARSEAAHVPPDLRAVVRDLERRWTAHGQPRPPCRGLLEHASLVGSASPPRTPVPAPLVAAGQKIVRAYYEARFGGAAPTPEGVRELREALLAAVAAETPSSGAHAARR